MGGARLKPLAPGLFLNPKLPSNQRTALSAAWEKFRASGEIASNDVGLATSGSLSVSAVQGAASSMPSVVVLSQAALEVSASAVNAHLSASGSDTWGLCLPTFHVGGYSIPLRAGLSGSRVAEFLKNWDTSEFHAWLSAEGVTLLSLVPTQVFDLVSGNFKAPPKLRAVVIGGGRLEESLHARALALGWPCLQSYGMTEASSQIATADLGSDGRKLKVLSHVEVRIDEQQKLWLRSKALLSAKIQFTHDGSSSLVRPVQADGWFESSDRGEYETDERSDGSSTGSSGLRHDAKYLKILGRDADTVKVLGELVDLTRVRSVIEAAADRIEKFHPFRQATWVVAVPHPRKGMELHLVIERGSRRLAEALLAETESELAPFERPTEITAVDQLPRSSLGKILSGSLTATVAARLPNA